MEHKILIEPIIRRPFSRLRLKKRTVVQAKQFELGFKIKNISIEPTNGFVIKKIFLKSSEGKDIIHTLDESFHINTLNPNSKINLWVGKFGTLFNGLADTGFDIVPDKENTSFETYQIDYFTKNISKMNVSNKWYDFLHVKSSSENAQNHASSVMIWLSVFVALLTCISVKISFDQARYNEIATKSARIEQARLTKQAKENCKTAPSSSPSGIYLDNGSGDEATCAQALKGRL